MVYYLGAVVALEFLLRIADGILGFLKGSSAKSEPAGNRAESKKRAPSEPPTYDRPAEFVPGRLPVVGAGLAAKEPLSNLEHAG